MSDMFPILFSYRAGESIEAIRKRGGWAMVIALPWPMLAKHEAQAQTNHGQTLKRLAARGGLGASEAVAILEDRRFSDMTEKAANDRLLQLMAAWEREPSP